MVNFDWFSLPLRAASRLGVPLVFSLLLAGCSDSFSSNQGDGFKDGQTTTTPPDNTEFDQTALLTSLVSYVFLPTIEQFQQQAQTLSLDVTAYCGALSNDMHSVEEETAKQQWRTTMAVWQQIEVMQVGPLAADDQLLRNTIYSWPLTNYCAVDQDVGHYEHGSVNGEAYDISRRTTNRRGLTTLEYLLFNDDLNHACSKDSLAPTGWNARPVAEKIAARCEFAAEVASDLVVNAQRLTTEWQSNGFATMLQTAGSQDNIFNSPHQAINAITDAMFYLDTITKDSKIGAPIGLSDNSCDNMACLDDIESNLADMGIDNVKNNLIAFQRLFLGGDPEQQHLGFDDYLIAVDASDLVTSMNADIAAAIALTEAFTGSTNDAVLTQPESIQAIYVAVKKVTDNLKSLFITHLSLELPLTSAGDAD
jgi:uncharacterized protein